MIKKLLLTLFYILILQGCLSNIQNISFKREHKLFSLNIDIALAYNGIYTFTLYKNSDNFTYLVTTTSSHYPKHNHTKPPQYLVKKLTLKESKILDTYLKKVNLISRKEKFVGLDGSTWCYSNQLESKVCLWSPTVETQKRHLNSFVKLGNYLWVLSELDKQNYNKLF